MSIQPMAATSSAPTGGAALDQVIGLSVGAAVVTSILLVIAWQHRTHRVEWFDRLGENLGAKFGVPGWVAIPVAFVGSSLIVAVIGYMWDVSIHAGKGRDAGPLANPAHYLILYGLFALFIAGMSAVIFSRDGEKPGIASVRITRQWYAPASGLMIAACGLYALIGFPLDDVWHRIFGQDVTLWGPTHLMLIGGAGLSTCGIILLVREGEFGRNRAGTVMPEWLRFSIFSITFGALLIGLSVFQGEFDFGISQFRMLFQPMLIALAAALPLVAARLYVGRGAALAAAVFFILMRGIVSFIVTDVFADAHHVFALYIGSAILIELLGFTKLKDNPLAFGAIGGLLIGTVGSVIELIWVGFVFQFPWAPGMWLEGLAMTVPVAIASGLAGALLALGLQGKLPSRATCRTIIIGGVLVVAAATANGLHATVPKNATATFAVTTVDVAGKPEITTKVTLSPADLVSAHPTWVQITAWQGGGVVTDRLRRTSANTWESTKGVPIGGNWKTLLRVQDGRMLTAVPIYLPADAPLNVKEVPTPAAFTRTFVPEIKILQRERKFDAPGWLWGVANLIVLLCSLGVIAGTSVTASRIARSIADAEAGAGKRDEATISV